MKISPFNKRRWRVFIILFITAVFIWVLNVSKVGRPSGCLQECASLPGSDEGPLKIITWNILHGYPDFDDQKQRLKLVAETLKEQEADVILLQEVPYTWRDGGAAVFLAERLEMNYVFARANGNRWAILFEEGAAVLSRFPLANPKVWELKPRAGFFEHRIVLSTEVETPQGRLQVYATHLTNKETAVNQAQADYLKSIVSLSCQKVCLVGGDFNATPDSSQIRELLVEWDDSFSALSAVGPGYSCCLDVPGPNDSQLTKRIDYLFLARGASRVEIVENKTFPEEESLGNGRLVPSDHLGVTAVFELRLID